MREAEGTARMLKINNKHWQGVVFSINKKKNPAIWQPSKGELNVRPLNCKSTGQKLTGPLQLYICNNVIIEWGWVWYEEWWGKNKINITASRISMNLHVMQELNSVNIVYCSFTLARIRANQITKNITKNYKTSVFSLSLPVGQISY